MARRWAKIPGPGQFRGEGKWVEQIDCPDDMWKQYKDGRYLPVYEGEEPPK